MPVLPPPRVLPSGVGRKVAVARLGVLWEGLWPRFVPLLGLVALFLTAAHLDVFSLLSPWIHTGVLALLAVSFAALAWRLFRDFSAPGLEDGQRRLESDNGIVHRPLQAVGDSLAAGTADPTARALWDLHRRREAERLANTRNRLPHPRMAALDGLALRTLPVLLLVVGMAFAGGWRLDRLEAALIPAFPPPPPVTADLWISPPAYTRKAPVYLDLQDGAKLVRVPVGSKLAGFVNDVRGRHPPKLVMDGQELEFTKVGEGKYQVETIVQGGSDIVLIARGDQLAKWPLHITPDLPPTIEFTREISVDKWSTRVDYSAADDFGVMSAQLQIRLHGSALGEDVDLGDDEPEIVRIDLPIPAVGTPRLEDTYRQDLTSHPWAGLKVTMRLIAVDAVGQDGRSGSATFLLPERVFKEAAARSVILMRKALSRDPRGNRDPVGHGLLLLNTRPDEYRDDPVVYMGLRVAANRLLNETTRESLLEVQKLLWDVALRIEGGALNDADRAVEQAERELREAIQREAGDEEIEKLIQQLHEAMSKRAKELAERMKDPAERERMRRERQKADRTITGNDLQKMLDKIREMARNGQREEAKRLLEELRKMMESMDAVAAEEGEGSEGQQGEPRQQQGMQGQQGREMMNELERMARRQNQLLGESEREMRGQQQGQQGQRGQQRGPQGQQGQQGPQGQGQQGQQPGQGQQGQQGQQQGQGKGGQSQADRGQPGGPSGGSPSDQLGRSQSDLRGRLGDLRNRMNDMGGKPSDSLGRSEEAMREAEEALRRGDYSGAARAQRRALEDLQQGMGDVAEQMRQNGPGNAQDRNEPEDGKQLAQDRDPLGRSEGNFGNAVDNGTTKVPTEPEMQRSREIMDELRRRAGDAERPQQELDYIDRLLRRF